MHSLKGGGIYIGADQLKAVAGEQRAFVREVLEVNKELLHGYQGSGKT